MTSVLQLIINTSFKSNDYIVIPRFPFCRHGIISKLWFSYIGLIYPFDIGDHSYNSDRKDFSFQVGFTPDHLYDIIAIYNTRAV